MPIIVSQSPERRWKGTQEGLVCFVVRFLHTSSALLSGFFERQLFVFPSLLRVFLRFASFLLTATAEQHCVARYDLAVSCFLLTVLRHKICCSGCCLLPATGTASLLLAYSAVALCVSTHHTLPIHAWRTFTHLLLRVPQRLGFGACIYRSHSSSAATDHSLYFRGELFNILLD